MTIVSGDVLRTTANFTLPDGTLYQNVYHHQRTGVGILTDSAHVIAIDTWLTALYTHIYATIRATTTADLCSVDRVAWDGSAWAVVENIGTFVHTFAPTGASEEMPNPTSPFVTFKTSRPGSVGRKFLFPMTETQFFEGILTGSTLTVIVAYADAVLTNIVVAALNDLVPGIPRTAVDVFLPFLIGVVTDVAGTQRRRRFGVGA